MKTKVLLYGISTFKNRGVEAIINSTLKMIDLKKYDVTLATYDYDYNKQMYKNIPKVNHYYKSEELSEEEKKLEEKYKNMPFDYHNFEKLYEKDVIKQIDKSDICISTGGDIYCYPFCNWAYTLDEYAHLAKKKTVLWGASLFDGINDDALIRNLNNFDVLVIRESISYQAVTKYIPKNRVILAPDPAFSLEKKEIQLNSWYKNRKIVALNVSPLTIQSEEQEQAINSLIQYILKHTKYSILLLPHVTTDDCNDLDILEKIYNNYKDENRIYLERKNYNCQELKYIISNCKLLIAARTHASIAAYSTGVPTLVIGYSVKSRGIAKDIFGEFDNYVISKDNLTAKNLINRFEYIDKNQEKIKSILKEKIPEIKEKSSNLFNMVIEKLKEQEEEQICKRDSCIGCGLCANKCPHGAITMVQNDEGFNIPKIDLKKCTKCDICRNNCPINKKKKEAISNFEPVAYAAINKNKDDQENSTSGGIFSILAKTILNEHGVVYGCYMHNNKANHIRISKEQDLNKIRGSKYIQSDIKNIFDSLKKDLNNKVKVLFCGTPCQIGAIQGFLRKEYNNLLLVSLICHGVMSQSIFEKYINEIEKEKGTEIRQFKFRTKKHKWREASIEYQINTNYYVEEFTDNPLMKLYLKNYILRPSCYECKFKGSNNKADIILGDFWGIEIVDSEMLDEKGVSALIINSKKGQNFLNDNKIFQEMNYKKEEMKNIIKYNSLLVRSANAPMKKEKAIQDLKTNSIKLVSNYYCDYLDLKQIIDKQKDKLLEKDRDNKKLEYELSSIINSKRWKTIDKLTNLINKLLRRK